MNAFALVHQVFYGAPQRLVDLGGVRQVHLIKRPHELDPPVRPYRSRNQGVLCKLSMAEREALVLNHLRAHRTAFLLRDCQELGMRVQQMHHVLSLLKLRGLLEWRKVGKFMEFGLKGAFDNE